MFRTCIKAKRTRTTDREGMNECGGVDVKARSKCGLYAVPVSRHSTASDKPTGLFRPCSGCDTIGSNKLTH